MIFRKLNKNDFPQVKNLYEKRLNLSINKKIYNYFYLNKYLNEYCSIVAEYKEKIIGHTAIIANKYYFKDKEIIIGLSSGQILLHEYRIIYYDMIKYSFETFKGDIIIGFPNNNVEKFFNNKIFNFNKIEKNYFSIDCSKIEYLKTLKDFECKSNFIRTKEYINWRINKHPINKYKNISANNTIVIYKEYHSNEIDIMYVNYFNDEFIKILIKLLENYKRINVIHWDRNYIKKIGFEEQKNNIFVYKNISNKINIPIFECQMIDSDVF